MWVVIIREYLNDSGFDYPCEEKEIIVCEKLNAVFKAYEKWKQNKKSTIKLNTDDDNLYIAETPYTSGVKEVFKAYRKEIKK